MSDETDVTIIARELLAQHGAQAAEVVEDWIAKKWTAPETISFWHKVLVAIKRPAAPASNAQQQG